MTITTLINELISLYDKEGDIEIRDIDNNVVDEVFEVCRNGNEPVLITIKR